MTHEEKVAYRCAILQGLARTLIMARINADDVVGTVEAVAFIACAVVDEMEKREAAKHPIVPLPPRNPERGIYP